jgi:hypothetical protein
MQAYRSDMAPKSALAASMEVGVSREADICNVGDISAHLRLPCYWFCSFLKRASISSDL